MGRLKLWGSVILILAVCAAGIWALWSLDLRWRPKTIGKHQAQIASLLEASGWVSPGPKGGRKLYVVAYRDCPDAARYLAEELPRLQAAGVEVRVIEVARRDAKGLAKSTPAERATVAQLWITRDWALLQQWMTTEPWTAAGIPPADGDMGRMAVVESGRQLVERLTPLLKDNGIKLRYPTLIWWDEKGEMRGCACEQPQTYRFVRRDLGA